MRQAARVAGMMLAGAVAAGPAAAPDAVSGAPEPLQATAAALEPYTETIPDTVVRFDPKTEQMRVVELPSNNVGIRKMVTDARGRLWYMGSHNGRLGLVE